MNNKTEQCFCQSHYDNNNDLQDCTCGKCGKPDSNSWEDEFDNLDIFSAPVPDKYNHKVRGYDDGLQTFVVDISEAKDFIRQALHSQKKLLIEEIPKRKMHSKGCPRFMDDDYICSCGASVYNKAIEDVIKQLKD